MQREIIKWIQSLDLSLPLKHPRRDLSNGFLVAEIISRYDTDVSMHSFDNGCSTKKKFDNWQLIRKILERRKCKSVTEDLIEDTLQARPDAGRILLENLYTHLTKKELKAPVIPLPGEAPDAAQPSYARKTAVAAIRAVNDETHDRLADLTGKKDEKTRLKRNDELLVNHHVTWKAYKMTETQHFQPTRHAKDGAPLRKDGKLGDTMNDTHNSTKGKGRIKQTITKEMNVRTIDTSVCEVFMHRDEQEKEEQFKAGFDLDGDLSSALSRVVHHPLQAFGIIEQIDTFYDPHRQQQANVSSGNVSSDGEGEHLTPPQHPGHSNPLTGDYCSKFVAHRESIGHEPKEATWRALQDAARNTAKLIAHRPAEAAYLTYVFGYLFTPSSVRSDDVGEEALHDRRRVLHFMSTVGQELVEVSTDAASQVLEQYLIPAVATAITLAAPGIFADIITMLMAFVNKNLLDDVKRLITGLQGVLEVGNPNRIHTAAYYALSTVDFGYCYGADSLAQYYASAALTHSSYISRTAGLLMVELLVDANFNMALVLFPQVKAMSTDSSWEQRITALAVLCRMAAVTLDIIHAAPYDGSEANEENDALMHNAQQAQEILPQVTEALERSFYTFETLASLSHRKLSLRTVAPYLHVVNNDMSFAFLKRLITLPDTDRNRLLLYDTHGNTIPVEAIAGNVREAYVIGGLSQVWNAPAVATALVQSREQFNSYEVLSVFEALVLSSDLAANRELWMAVLAQVKADLLNAIFDPANCRGVSDQHQLSLCAEMATSATTKYYAELSGETIDASGASFSEIQQLAIEWLQSNA